MLALVRRDLDRVRRSLASPILEVAARDLDPADAMDLDRAGRGRRAGEYLSDGVIADRTLQREDRVGVATQRRGGSLAALPLAVTVDLAVAHDGPDRTSIALREPPRD